MDALPLEMSNLAPSTARKVRGTPGNSLPPPSLLLAEVLFDACSTVLCGDVARLDDHWM